jgi:hypothetical protein
MKRDMVELKKLVADIIEHGGVSAKFCQNHSQTLKRSCTAILNYLLAITGTTIHFATARSSR